jgi:hypothetical protein
VLEVARSLLARTVPDHVAHPDDAEQVRAFLVSSVGVASVPDASLVRSRWVRSVR